MMTSVALTRMIVVLVREEEVGAKVAAVAAAAVPGVVMMVVMVDHIQVMEVLQAAVVDHLRATVDLLPATVHLRLAMEHLLVMADRRQVMVDHLQAMVHLLPAMAHLLRAMVGHLQVMVGHLQAMVGRVQAMATQECLGGKAATRDTRPMVLLLVMVQLLEKLHKAAMGAQLLAALVGRHQVVDRQQMVLGGRPRYRRVGSN